MIADPKPAPRRRDPDLMRFLHAQRFNVCALCETVTGLELHHILPRSQRGDDVRANLAFLCLLDHRLITLGDEETRREFGQYLLRERSDTIAYLSSKGATGWAERQLFIDITWLARRPS